MITRDTIYTVLSLNRISGKIETGQRYWIAEYISVSYSRPELNETAKFLRELSDYCNYSLAPIYPSPLDLGKRVHELATLAYADYLTNNKTSIK